MTFHVFLALHIVVGLACVIAGIVAMLSKKQPGRHPRFGTIYYWSLAVVFVTATGLAVLRWSQDYHLFIIGAFSFGAATLGRTAIRKRRRVRLHIAGMGFSYILMLVAFYVDNGKNLPLWKDLPPVFYWLIPTIVGLPILVYVLLRHPLARPQQGR